MPRRPLAVIALSIVSLLWWAPPAWAHVEIDPAEAVAGSVTTLHISVAYEGSPTNGLVVQLPDGASVTSVPDKAGWTSSSDDGENTVTWAGGSSTEDEVFDVEVQLPTTTGEVLFSALVQTGDGEVAWIEREEGGSHDGHPAPRLTLVVDPNASSTTSTEASTTTDPPTTTESDLPGTTLEAQERDDGGTSAAPWIIGSGLAAAAAIAIGGTILKRRQR